MEWTSIIAERQIKEAMDNGEFDDLPGKGQPLNLDEDMSIPIHQRMVARVLKNARALPEWLQAEKDIARETEAAQTLRERGVANFQRAKTDERRGRIGARLRTEYKDRMDLVNTLILKYNQFAPQGYCRVFAPFAIAREMQALDDELGNFVAPPIPTPAEERRTKRQQAALLLAQRNRGR
jgi:hypothetical protein